MVKRHKSMSIPRDYWEKLERMYKDTEDVCSTLQISSAVELFRVLANFGEARFLEIVEEVRKKERGKS